MKIFVIYTITNNDEYHYDEYSEPISAFNNEEDAKNEIERLKLIRSKSKQFYSFDYYTYKEIELILNGEWISWLW